MVSRILMVSTIMYFERNFKNIFIFPASDPLKFFIFLIRKHSHVSALYEDPNENERKFFSVNCVAVLFLALA